MSCSIHLIHIPTLWSLTSLTTKVWSTVPILSYGVAASELLLLGCANGRICSISKFDIHVQLLWLINTVRLHLQFISGVRGGSLSIDLSVRFFLVTLWKQLNFLILLSLSPALSLPPSLSLSLSFYLLSLLLVRIRISSKETVAQSHWSPRCRHPRLTRITFMYPLDCRNLHSSQDSIRWENYTRVDQIKMITIELLDIQPTSSKDLWVLDPN